MRVRPWRLAQRPLPSMTIATCAGTADAGIAGGCLPVQSSGTKSTASRWVFSTGATRRPYGVARGGGTAAAGAAVPSSLPPPRRFAARRLARGGEGVVRHLATAHARCPGIVLVGRYPGPIRPTRTILRHLVALRAVVQGLRRRLRAGAVDVFERAQAALEMELRVGG